MFTICVEIMNNNLMRIIINPNLNLRTIDDYPNW